jgi:regulator of sigma E protease
VEGYSLEDVNLVIVSVSPESPAEKAGLKTGDKIMLARSGDDIIIEKPTTDTLKEFIVSHPGKKIEIGYTRGMDKDINLTTVTPVINEGSPVIGISMDQIGTAKLPFLVAFKEGMNLTLFVTKNTAVGLYTLIFEGFQGKGNLATITGPVGMVGIVGDAYEFGFVYLLSFTALISINLAIINLIPFPALDGGRLFFLIIEKIKGSRLNPKIMNTANIVGFFALILLNYSNIL